MISVSFQKPCESLLGAQDNKVPAQVEAVYAACLHVAGLMNVKLEISMSGPPWACPLLQIGCLLQKGAHDLP